jgi:hypothetical protein
MQKERRRRTREAPWALWMKRDDGAVSVGTRQGDEPGNGVGTGRVIEHGKMHVRDCAGGAG